MSTEFELKLEVPAAREKAVSAALARLHPATESLRAIYFDTPERLLQREGMVLRLRSEDGRWVQTLKADSGRPLERFEHEVTLARTRGTPRPLAARHAGCDAGERLVRLLGRGFDDGTWEPLFETDVRRTKATVTEAASQVEIAFDRGHIASGRRKVPLCEIEFELKRGEPRAAVDMARRWARQHGLWLSTISKAQKGVMLASKPGTFGPAASAVDPDVDAHASLRRIGGEALAASLDQVIRNASALAAGSTQDEHIHQMRVGLRRARTALRDLVREEDVAAQEEALVHAFRELGRHRDMSHVLGAIEPKLREAGSPPPARIVRAPRFQEAVLHLLALACELRADGGRTKGAKDEVGRRLAKLHKKTLRDGVVFERLAAPRQHRVRKRLKRLRYLAEFTVPLHDKKALKAYLAKLKKVQEALGDYNDGMTALAHYRDRPRQDAQACLAVGWLQAQRERLARDCGRRLRKLAKADPFWR